MCRDRESMSAGVSGVLEINKKGSIGACCEARVFVLNGRNDLMLLHPFFFLIAVRCTNLGVAFVLVTIWAIYESILDKPLLHCHWPN